MVRSMVRLGAGVCTMLVTMMSLQVLTGPPAHAASCSWPKKGYQVCTGIRHEVLSSKFYKGTSSYFNGKGGQSPSLYVNGKLKDKQADGRCTWLRVRATGPYWPESNPNIYTQPKWKVCGAGNEKVIGIQLDQAWTYPGTTLKIQHCYAYNNGAGIFCSTFFKRTIPTG